MFTATALKTPTATIRTRWFTHPTQLKCICGVTLYAKRIKDADSIKTVFICETPKCGQVILFEDKVNGQ